MPNATELQKKKCVPCEGGVQPISQKTAESMLDQIPGWELIESGTKLRRTFSFANFLKAQDFAVQVGSLAESENHHPDISYGWAYCAVVFFTHKIGGLHENDFIMAAKVNALGC